MSELYLKTYNLSLLKDNWDGHAWILKTVTRLASRPLYVSLLLLTCCVVYWQWFLNRLRLTGENKIRILWKRRVLPVWEISNPYFFVAGNDKRNGRWSNRTFGKAPFLRTSRCNRPRSCFFSLIFSFFVGKGYALNNII